MSDYGVVLFNTTSAAMRSEKVLQKEQLDIKMIPTPRGLSSDCGVALRFDWTQAENVRDLLYEAGVEVEGIHQIQG